MNDKIDAKKLGIDLASGKESGLFKWFLVCLLFEKPIRQEIIEKAYRLIITGDITSINKLVRTDWDRLVDLLDTAHYVRYDFSTATKVLHIAKNIKTKYGTLSRMVKQSENAEDLEEKLLAFGGISPATVSMFSRGVVPVFFKEFMPINYESAFAASEILRNNGFEAYIIGGAVRDMWLGREPKDFDLVTDARPEQIMAISQFINSGYKDTAQAFGVTRVKFSHRGAINELEIATFRKDIEAHMGRKATKIEYSDLIDDVERRDFTINALALDTSTDFVIDFVGGIEDLNDKRIRFIGRPFDRINEDPLRILRAIRFKNQLNFIYHPQTVQAIKQAVERGYVEKIAVDRLRDELTGMLLHPSRRNAVVDLDEFGILDLVLPEVTAGKGIDQPREFHMEGDVWRHELLMLECLPKNPSKRLAWAALLHDIGKAPTITKPHVAGERIRFNRHHAVGAEMTKTILLRLKFSNRDVEEISWMVHEHMTVDDLPSMRPSSQQRIFGHPAFEDLLALHRADAAASLRPDGLRNDKPKFRGIERLWHQYQNKTPEMRQPSLKKDVGIDGDWLIDKFKDEFGDIGGPVIGKILNELDELYSNEGIKDENIYFKRARQILAKEKI